jgi:hypothetical protein
MAELPNFGPHNKAIWLGLAALGVAVGLYLRHRSSSQSTDTSTTPDMPNVDGSTDNSYSSGDVQAIPGTQYGMPGPAGPPGPRGQRGKRGPRGAAGGKKHKHHGTQHHKPAGSHAQPRIAVQSHMGNGAPVASHVRVIQHGADGTVRKGARKSNG